MTDELRCPVPGHIIRRWKRFAYAHPWQGNLPLADRHHFLDTTAILEPERPVRLALSFDVGYHGSGWFANSEWEQNLHLSLSHPRIDKPTTVMPRKPEGPLMGQGRGYELETVSDDEA